MFQVIVFNNFILLIKLLNLLIHCHDFFYHLIYNHFKVPQSIPQAFQLFISRSMHQINIFQQLQVISRYLLLNVSLHLLIFVQLLLISL